MSVRGRVVIVGAAAVAEVAAHLAFDSALLSLTAFGSVTAVGLLHLRSRRARAPAHPTARADTLPDVPTMPAPSKPNFPASTPPAISELAQQLDDLKRELAPDPQAAARVETVLGEIAASVERAGEGAAPSMKLQRTVADARHQVANLLAELAARQARGDQESAARAQELAATCKAIEGRLAATEERLVAQAVRIETAADEQLDRLASQSREALARICADLGSLRDDVTRAGQALDELRAGARAPSPLAEESARALAEASESAAALARRVAQLHERLDAQGARFEDALGEGFRAARAQVDELARSADALQALSERLGADVASVETRLAEKLDALRDAVDRLPSSPPVDLAPLYEAHVEAEARLGERLASIPADTHALLADHLHALPAEVAEQVRATLPPAPSVEPALRRSEERLAARLAGLVDEVSDRVVAHLPPAPPPVDLQPVRDALARVQRAVADAPSPEPVAAPLRETETRLAAKLDALPSEVASRIDARLEALPRETSERVLAALPAPPTERILAGVETAEQRILGRLEPTLRAIRQGVDALPREPPAAVATLARDVAEMGSKLDGSRVALDEGLQRLAASIEALPAPPEVDLAPVLASLEKLRDAQRHSRREDHARLDAAVQSLRDAIAAIPPAPAAPSLDPVLAGVKESEERLAKRLAQVREAVSALPASIAPTSLDPVVAAVNAAEERLARRAAAHEEAQRLARREESARLEATLRGLREVLAALPTAAPNVHVDLAPISSALRESEERIARRFAGQEDAQRSWAREEGARIEAAVREMRGAIDALPAKMPATDLAPVLDALRGAEERLAKKDLGRIDADLRSLRAAIEQLPRAMLTVDLAPVLGKLGEAEERAVGAHREHATSLARIERLAQAAAAPREDIATPVVQAVTARLDFQADVLAERLAQSETRVLVDVAQRHDEQLANVAKLARQLELAAGRIETRADEDRKVLLGGFEAASRALAEHAEAHAAGIATLREATARASSELARALDAAARQSAEDAVAIHETVEDVLTEMDAKHRRLESFVEKLGREMDARMATLEARLLDELRASRPRPYAPRAPEPLGASEAPAVSMRPRRQLRRPGDRGPQ